MPTSVRTAPLAHPSPGPLLLLSVHCPAPRSGRGRGTRWASLERVTFVLGRAATPASDASGLYLCVSTGPWLCSNLCPVRREPPPRPGLGQAQGISVWELVTDCLPRSQGGAGAHSGQAEGRPFLPCSSAALWPVPAPPTSAGAGPLWGPAAPSRISTCDSKCQETSFSRPKGRSLGKGPSWGEARGDFLPLRQLLRGGEPSGELGLFCTHNRVWRPGLAFSWDENVLEKSTA